MVDYTSRFPIVRDLKSMSAQHVTEHFRLIFSEYGWPDTLVSDNGPCYVAETFTYLMKEYAVNHITSSPHYPQSNELAEKFIQIVKNLFYKVKDEGTDIYKCLMIYCNTPIEKHFQITHADVTTKICQITAIYVECSIQTTWNCC